MAAFRFGRTGLALTLILGLASASFVPGAGASASVDATLLSGLSAGSGFYVQLSARAGLAGAYAQSDWAARGAYVWEALSRVARQSQAPVLDYCREHSLDCRSLVASNSVYVRSAGRQAALDLAALPGVASLRLERSVRLADSQAALAAEIPQAVTSWGLLDSGAVDTWALGVRGAGVRVANIDTGVQWEHPALLDSYGCPGDPGNPACWFDPTGECGDEPCDTHGHGTFTMGILVANDDPDLPYVAGMAPDATWIACKACGQYGGCSDYNLNACADWLLAPGGDPAARPMVVSAPWGGMGCDAWFRPNVQAWLAAGIFASFPVGAQGPACFTIGSPADYAESFAGTAHDANRAIAPFAARGPACYGNVPYTKPNLSAPGVNICSSVPTDAWDCWSGTSPATSFNAGAAALVYSACPDLVGQVHSTFELLQDTAGEPPDGNCGAPPGDEGNYTYGYGYLDVLAAVQACAAPVPMHVADITGYFTLDPYGRTVLRIYVLVLDDGGAPVPTAEVVAEITPPSAPPVQRTRMTRANGRARFHWGSAASGEWELCVLDITKEGYLYDPADNLLTCKQWQN